MIKREKMKKECSLFIAVIMLILMVACTSEPQKTTENKPTSEAKPAFQSSFETGRAALQRVYIAARNWSVDSRPYRLESQPTKDANGHDGKSGIWQAGFASPSKREIKLFSWSGIKADDAPEPGINSRPADTYNPSNTSTQIFDLVYLKKDSTDAFEVAQKHGGEKILKSSPDTQVFYELDWNPRENKLYWRVIYGVSKNDPKLAVDVDASTGDFIKVEK